jgi:tripartite-type tricarboxylate transporter receptor subunit TctC
VLQAPDLHERIIADGFTPAYSKPEEYCERLEKDVARWKDVVKKANIKINVIG